MTARAVPQTLLGVLVVAVLALGGQTAAAQYEPAATAPEEVAATTTEAPSDEVVTAETEPGISPTVTVTRTETVVEAEQPPSDTTPASTTTAVRPGAAAAVAAAQEDDSSSTDWGWIAFAALAGAVFVGGIVWLVRRRGKKTDGTAPPAADVST